MAAAPDPSVSSQRIKEPLFSLVVMLGRHVGKEAASQMAYGLGDGGEKKGDVDAIDSAGTRSKGLG